MQPRRFEFLTDQAQPEEPGTEGVFLIFRLRPRVGRVLLIKRLIADGEAELDIAFDLSGMKRRIKQPVIFRGI